MFRKITISLTLAALSSVAIISAAPALAAPADEGAIPTTDVGGFRLDFTEVVAAAMEGAPAGTAECSVETGDDWVPCIDLGSLLGFPTVAEPEDEAPLTPGGVVTDAPVGVVEPESDLVDPGLLPDISDIVDFPGLSDADETEGAESDGLVGIVEGPGLAEALREAGIATIEDAADADELFESDEPAPGTETVPTPADETMVAAVTGVDGTTTTTVPVVDDTDGDQTALATVELAAPVESGGGIDPLLGALFGALAALAVTGVGFAAFKLGRRGA